MLGFYNYTVVLTYVSLLISSVGVYLAAAGQPFYALCCLLASGICDMFDGKIARTRKKSTDEEKRFGIQIDSLCDVICFGVLPSAIGVSLVASQTLPVRIAVWALAALYILCGLIRLGDVHILLGLGLGLDVYLPAGELCSKSYVLSLITDSK